MNIHKKNGPLQMIREMIIVNPVAERILNSKQSINIDGRAWVGNLDFITNLHQEMDEGEI